jgi:molecular chaperone GrpE
LSTKSRSEKPKKKESKRRRGRSEPATPSEPTSRPDDAPAEELAQQGLALEKKLEELDAELIALREESKGAEDRALRTLAEFDNYRKRSERERSEARTNGVAEVLTELFDLADNFDRALEHAGDDVPAPFLEGMNMVARGLHDLFDRRGVAPIECIGKPFDPHVHEALTSMPSADVPPNTVVQEIQRGYAVGERVLRPAKVIVSSPMPEATS